jgi:DNA-binding CsgD family transcriptional regulator
MEELRLMAERLRNKANQYTDLKLASNNEEEKQSLRDREIACLECISEIYTRILEIQTQN